MFESWFGSKHPPVTHVVKTIEGSIQFWQPETRDFYETRPHSINGLQYLVIVKKVRAFDGAYYLHVTFEGPNQSAIKNFHFTVAYPKDKVSEHKSHGKDVLLLDETYSAHLHFDSNGRMILGLVDNVCKWEHELNDNEKRTRGSKKRSTSVNYKVEYLEHAQV